MGMNEHLKKFDLKNNNLNIEISYYKIVSRFCSTWFSEYLVYNNLQEWCMELGFTKKKGILRKVGEPLRY